MGIRKHLGIVFSYNESWIGGTYYIVNLIHALNVISETDKPDITIICSNKSTFTYIENETKYPFLFYLKDRSEKPLLAKAINAFSLRLVKKKLIEQKLPDKFDLVFPNPIGEYFSLLPDKKKVYWIPDFQELHLPDFFSSDELIEIKQRQIAQAYKAKKMVLSSLDAKNDFNRLYPDVQAKVYVIPFSVTHPDFASINFDLLKVKYGINKPYFFAPNQFWVHKNQEVVIQAVKRIVAQEKDILVLFSGKENDYRHPDYTSHLKKMVLESRLDNNIKFLGFIDRREQLSIMKNAKAVIQPSLFEGWSTVIEDAKAINKKIIASDLRVHREQLSDSYQHVFFNPHSCDSLIDAIIDIDTCDSVDTVADYNKNKLAHGQAFYSLFNDLDS